MGAAPLPPNEAARLRALRALHILDTPPEPAYDALVALASAICETPVSLITLIDSDRQWFKANFGLLGIESTSRDSAFCAHAILEPHILEVPDSLKDQRFVDNALVVGFPHIRYYAGSPLITSDGDALGTLCVIDYKPHILSVKQRDQIALLSAIAVDLIETHSRVFSRTQDQLATIINAAEAGNDVVIVYEWDRAGTYPPKVRFVNDAFVERTGYAREEAMDGTSTLLCGPLTDVAALREALSASFGGDRATIDLVFYRKDGSSYWAELGVRPIVEPSGRIGRSITVERDITAQRLLEERVETLNAVIEQADDDIVVYDVDPPNATNPRIAYVNDSFVRKTGYTRDEIYGHMASPFLFGPKTDRSVAAHGLTELRAGLPSRMELFLYRKDGSTYWSEWNSQPIRDRNGAITRWVSVERDVTERKSTEARIRNLTSAMDTATDYIFVTDANPISEGGPLIEYANESFTREMGYADGELLGHSPRLFYGPLTDRAAIERISTSIRDAVDSGGEFLAYRKDGTTLWVEFNGRPVYDAEHHVTGWVAIGRNVSAKKQRDEALSFEATHDPLTRLFNRRYFEGELERAIASARGNTASHVLAYLDLDRFKPINDRYGHDAGDAMLVGFSACVAARLRGNDVFARLGGDEFAILLLNCAMADGKRLVETIAQSIDALRVDWEGHSLSIGASFGLLSLDASSPSIAEVMRAVDAACYISKRTGGERITTA